VYVSTESMILPVALEDLSANVICQYASVSEEERRLLKRSVVVMSFAVLLLSSLLPVFVKFSVHALNADSMWIEPSTIDLTGKPVGTRFNVTIWLNVTSPTHLWQFYLRYKRTQIEAVRCDYTGNGKSVWSGSLWTGSVVPSFGVEIDETYGYVLFGETLGSGDENTGFGSLAWVEFQTMPASSTSRKVTSELTLDIEGVFSSYIMDKSFHRISLTFGRATYSNVVHGPVMDTLHVQYYNNSSALYDALKNGEVDLTDRALTSAQMEEVFNRTDVQAAISPTYSMYEFDFNNNATVPTYPNQTSPTAYKEFRQGIACLVDKDYIVDNLCPFSYRIDTPISRPNCNWWVDESVSQYDSYGNLLGNYPYEYNSSVAASYFDQAGFVEGEESNPEYDPEFPGSTQHLRIHPATGTTMEPLIFYIRNEYPERLEAGRNLATSLRKLGIPVAQNEENLATCIDEVMVNRDYNIYTGGWTFDVGVESLSCYVSSDIDGADYPQFRNSTYDDSYSRMMSTLDLGSALDAAKKCQRILVEEAACVWLYSTSVVTGYRDLYCVVNQRGERIDNQFTFLKTRNDSKAEIDYGLYNPPASLNVITHYSGPAWDCLSRIYDTLISYCPYATGPDRESRMPWLAADWDIEEWESPYETGKNLTKLTFYLREGTQWHDGVGLNSSDVKFTIDYIRGLGPNVTPLYYYVSNVDHVVTPNPSKVIVYVNVSNTFTIDYIGTLPILPKHIFQNISNVTGYTPGASQGFNATQTLIGTGPWNYVSHNSSMLLLEANRAYFLETPPKSEIDFRYNWEVGGWTVDALDVSMVGELFGMDYGMPSLKWEPGCDVHPDKTIDLMDIVIVSHDFNLTWGMSGRRYFLPAPTDCAVFVEPLENPIVVGENLTVYVKMFAYNLTELSGVQFKLNYDNSKLNCLGMSVAQIFGDYTCVTKSEINQTNGFIWVTITTCGQTQLFGGNTTLATITFNTTKPSGSTMDLWSTEIATTGVTGLTCQPLVHKTLDRSVMVAVSTPTGTNVTVAPAENAKVTFNETTSGGVTTLNITQAPSNEFASVLCNDIKTTANYTGNVTIQFSYDSTGLSLEDEQAMKIWLWNASSSKWLDITTHVDTDNNIVYGTAPHLSMFGVTKSLSLDMNITKQGEIYVGTPQSPPNLPAGLMPLNYYEIDTTATYTGSVGIKLQYNDAPVPPGLESFVQLWQWDTTSQTWVEVTTSVDTQGNFVYGVAPHLSMFGVTCIMPQSPGIAVSGGTFSKTVVGEGFSVAMNVTVQNQGDFHTTFDVFVYANASVIFGQTVSDLAPGAQTTMTFSWNTVGWSKGMYEVSTCNNLLGWIAVTIPGDVTGDFKVKLEDITSLLDGFGSTRSSDGWYRHKLPCLFCPHSPNLDVDWDAKVALSDINAALDNFGKHYP